MTQQLKQEALDQLPEIYNFVERRYEVVDITKLTPDEGAQYLPNTDEVQGIYRSVLSQGIIPIWAIWYTMCCLTKEIEAVCKRHDRERREALAVATEEI